MRIPSKYACIFLSIRFLCLQHVVLNYPCIGVGHRVEDNAMAVVLLENRAEEVYVSSREKELEEGQRIVLRADCTGECTAYVGSL